MAEAARKMNIYEAISRCMEEIGAVGKDAVNKQQGFKYRGIDAVMNAINPALVNGSISGQCDPAESVSGYLQPAPPGIWNLR